MKLVRIPPSSASPSSTPSSYFDRSIAGEMFNQHQNSNPTLLEPSRSEGFNNPNPFSQGKQFSKDRSTLPISNPSSPSNSLSSIQRVEAMTSHLSPSSINLLFLLLWLFGAVLSLDRLTTYSYQTIATNSFNHHSELALVNVVRSILAAIIGPPFSLICDLWGRKWAFAIGLTLYMGGHIVMASSQNVAHYIGGCVLYEAGANALVSEYVH